MTDKYVIIETEIDQTSISFEDILVSFLVFMDQGFNNDFFLFLV